MEFGNEIWWLVANESKCRLQTISPHEYMVRPGISSQGTDDEQAQRLTSNRDLQQLFNTTNAVTVVGVRMNGTHQAVVRAEMLGFKFSVTMVYEGGQWLRAPDDDFAAPLGQPLDILIASEKAAGRCLKDSPPPTFSVPGSTT